MSVSASDGASGPTVGILGGGQLARMLALAGHPLGIRCVVLDPGARPPAASVARHIRAAYDDQEALAALAASCQVVTYEFENVPDASVRALAERVPVRPGHQALAVCQDRLLEKQALSRLGLTVPRFAPVERDDQLEAAGTAVGFPAVLKTRRLGYDGKGQRVVLRAADLRDAFLALGSVPCLLEHFVSFDAELALLAVRDLHGQVRAWPLTMTTQEDGVLRAASAPAPRHAHLQVVAEAHAARVLTDLDYVGVLALEFFAVGDTLWGNELAPRVHNSGHWTIEGSTTSQFENHLRAILGLPLGLTDARAPVRLVNLLGDLPPLDAVLAIPGAHLHLYDKDPAPGRKLGHVTLVGAPGRERDLDGAADTVAMLHSERRRKPR